MSEDYKLTIMKELSIEEKAQKYDRAIERANSLLSSNELGNAWIYKLLPELKESENERIKNFICNELACLRATDKKGTIRYNELTEAITWLEKQGNNNMGISEATKQKLEDSLNKALEKETPESCNEFLKKQGEQKPDTDFSDLRTWKYVVDAVLTKENGIGNYLNSARTEAIAKELQERFGKIEQSTAWSEEDKYYYGIIQYFLNNESVGKADKENAISWFQSLKDRYAWKPSEQEKAVLRTAIHIMTRERNFPKLGAQLQNILDVFEGNSRVDWKPSDEQIKTLEFVIKSIDDMLRAIGHIDNFTKPRLEEILVALKKLREE